MDDAKHLTKVCLPCWEHLWDFNNFKQAVHVAQANLDAVKHINITLPTQETNTNVAIATVQDVCQNTTTSDPNGDYICLTESDDESREPNATQVRHNVAGSLNQTNADVADVDLTIDEEIAPTNVGVGPTYVITEHIDYEGYDEPVGVFSGGEFSNGKEHGVVQPDSELIDLDSDSNLSVNEFRRMITPETLTASETDLNNLENFNNLNANTTNSNQSEEQSASSSRMQQEFVNSLSSFNQVKSMHLECAICSELCYRYYILREHFNRKHPHLSIQINCCNRRHTGFKVIWEHLMSHNTPTSLVCELCGRTYVRMHYLRRHINTHHPGEGYIIRPDVN